MTQPEDFVVKGQSFPIAPPQAFSEGFLSTVVDALPEALAVIDRNFNVVLANKAARNETQMFDAVSPSFKCFACFHGRSTPCTSKSDPFEGEHGACPLQRVIDTKAATRVYHTHYDENHREVSMAVDAAPIFDKSGEVALIVETCRDVTERCLSRRLCRTGNRHMKMKPLLDEYAIDIGQFAQVAKVRIHVFENCAIHEDLSIQDCGSACEESNAAANDAGGGPHCQLCTNSICVRHLRRVSGDAMPPATRFGSVRFNQFLEFLDQLPKATRDRLSGCTWTDCDSVALVPIRLTDVDLGLLQVADPQPNVISEEMVESLERLSLDLGAAIHRVRIEEELLTTRRDLEARVRQRTEQLTEANRSLQNEIAERVRLERELLQAGVREQQRIGQELHDGVGQELTGMGYLAQNLLMTLKNQDSPASETTTEMATDLAHAIPRVMGQIQNIVRGLIPLEIGAADLELALELLAANTEKQTGINCQFSVAGYHLIDNDDIPIQIYRIAQEALANAVKHAHAQRIDITLRSTDEAIQLEVADDGVGIQTGAESGPGSGLRSMRYRARAVGGQLTVTQRSSKGTVVECNVPRVTSTQ